MPIRAICDRGKASPKWAVFFVVVFVLVLRVGVRFLLYKVVGFAPEGGGGSFAAAGGRPESPPTCSVRIRRDYP